MQLNMTRFTADLRWPRDSRYKFWPIVGCATPTEFMHLGYVAKAFLLHVEGTQSGEVRLSEICNVMKLPMNHYAVEDIMNLSNMKDSAQGSWLHLFSLRMHQLYDTTTWDQPFRFLYPCPLFTFWKPFSGLLIIGEFHYLRCHITYGTWNPCTQFLPRTHHQRRYSKNDGNFVEQEHHDRRAWLPSCSPVAFIVLRDTISNATGTSFNETYSTLCRVHMFFLARQMLCAQSSSANQTWRPVPIIQPIAPLFPSFVVGRNVMYVRGWERPCVCLCESILGSPRIISLPLSVLAILSLSIRFVVPHAPTIAGLIEWAADLFIRQFDSQS